MNIGYACLTIGVPGTDIKSCMKKNADEACLNRLIAHNLASLENIMDYNIQNGIRLFRISSDLIPFGSSPVNTLAWHETFAERFHEIGEKIRSGGIRVSMHPGQYTVLNSPNRDVADRAVVDLEYHARVLDCLGVDEKSKIILHIGGAYGDKKRAVCRFVRRIQNLDHTVRRRVVIENDQKLYHIEDVLEIGTRLGLPVVFDILHHRLNPPAAVQSDADWIRLCADTWKEKDGPQKIHYSEQHPAKRAGSHSDTVHAETFTAFCRGLGRTDFDIMLEVKDKNLSAVKCINCLMSPGRIGVLEKEWSRYKYTVLERSPGDYTLIRELLKNKNEYPALEFYRVLEQTLAAPVEKKHAVNAAAHVWGYFKHRATGEEKRRWTQLLNGYEQNKNTLAGIKRFLFRLAQKYDRQYLISSYYFAI